MDSIEALLAGSRHVIGRADALEVVTRHRLDNEVKSGRLTAVFPRTYCRPWDADVESIRWLAALTSVGGDVGLSHTTALRAWQLPIPDDLPVHVKAYQPRHPRGVPGSLVVHRTLLPLRAQLVDDFPAVPIEVALIDAWPLLSGSDQRAPMIESARRRLLNPGRLKRAAESMFWVPGIGTARDLVGMVLAGCESELELYGFSDVFTAPELSDAKRQLWVRVGTKSFRLDMAFEEERLNVELDGRKYHSGERREKDIARDRVLAQVGWQTLRYSHEQLHGDPIGCCREVVAVRAERRRMLRIA